MQHTPGQIRDSQGHALYLMIIADRGERMTQKDAAMLDMYRIDVHFAQYAVDAEDATWDYLQGNKVTPLPPTQYGTSFEFPSRIYRFNDIN